MWKIPSIAAVATVALLGGYGSALAGTCPQPPVDGSRVFTLTGNNTDPTCYASGTGNDPTPAGYTLIDKYEPGAESGPLQITGLGTTSGTWTISGVTGYTDLILALKSGEGQLDPDWAEFLIYNSTTGTWGITGQQSLSHASLYGIACTNCPNPETPPAVPLPGPVWMMLATLASLGIYGWYRRRTAVV